MKILVLSVLLLLLAGCNRQPDAPPANPAAKPTPQISRALWDIHADGQKTILDLVQSNGIIYGRMAAERTGPGGADAKYFETHRIRGTQVTNHIQFQYAALTEETGTLGRDDYHAVMEEYLWEGNFENGRWSGTIKRETRDTTGARSEYHTNSTQWVGLRFHGTLPAEKCKPGKTDVPGGELTDSMVPLDPD